MKDKNKKEIITTHNLGKYILETGKVPTPIYRKSQEYKTNPEKTIEFNATLGKTRDDEGER